MLLKLCFLLMIFPLSAMAEEIVVSPAYLPEGKVLNLTYNPPLDPYFCNKNLELCKNLEIKNYPVFDMLPRATNKQWLAFWTFQVLDAYSTSRALKYDCVKEINPLYTERPSDFRIVATKSFLILPGLLYENYWTEVTPDELNNTNMLYSIVVANNFRLLEKAKDNCNKIR